MCLTLWRVFQPTAVVPTANRKLFFHVSHAARLMSHVSTTSLDRPTPALRNSSRLSADRSCLTSHASIDRQVAQLILLLTYCTQ